MKKEIYYFFCMLNYEKFVLEITYNNDWSINVIKGDDSFNDFKYIHSSKIEKDDIYDYLKEYFDVVYEIEENEIVDIF
jgi:hypothetical protein